MTYSTNVLDIRRVEQLKEDVLFKFATNKYNLKDKTLKSGLIATAIYSIHIVVTAKTYHPNTINNAIRSYFCLKGEKAISNENLRDFIIKNTNSDIEEVDIIQVCKYYYDFTDDIPAYSNISELYRKSLSYSI